MKNYVSEGNTITIVAAAAVSSGDIVAENELVGVAAGDAASGAALVLNIEGVFRLPKITGAINAGDKVDFDSSAGSVGKGITPASGDVSEFGIAMSTAASGDTHVDVKLLPGNGALT